MKGPGRRLRRWVATGIISLGTAAVGLLLLEGAVRLLGPADLVPQTYDPRLIDARAGKFPHMNRAGYRGTVRGRPVSINSLGLRGPELPAGGTPRLLLLGDSVLFAPGVGDEHSPGPILQRRLQDRYVVLNASVLGWSSQHQLAFLKEFGDRLTPAVIVLGYCLNDPVPHGDAVFLRSEANAPRWPGLLIRLNLLLRKHSLLFVWLKGALGASSAEHGFAAYVEPLFAAEPWRRNTEVLLAMRDYSRARGITFMVAVFPHREQLEDPRTGHRPQELLEELGRREGFQVIDLLPDLEAEDYLYGDPIHLDRTGIEKAVARIAEHVLSAETVPPPSREPGGEEASPAPGAPAPPAGGVP